MKALAVVLVGLLAVPVAAAEKGTPFGDPASTFSLASGQESTSTAEWYLRDLVDASRRARKLGYVAIGLGAAVMVGGIVVLAGVDDSDGFEGFFKALGGIGLLSLGVAGLGGGALMLTMASGPERRYAAIRTLTDAAERERASRAALVSLARSGKTKRLIVGGLFSALAAAALVSSSDQAEAALIPGGLALYQFLSRSREERAYRAFLATEEAPSESVFVGFGPGPRGGWRAAVTISF